MLIKLDVKDKEAVIKMCAKLDFIHRFYTIENTDLMCQCEILQDDGRELLIGSAYHFGRMVQLEVEMQQSNAKLKRFPF